MSNPFDVLIPEEPPEEEGWRWATIETVSPLTLRFDGEVDPAPVEVDTLIDGLQVGDHVWCQRHGVRVIVNGSKAKDARSDAAVTLIGSIGNAANLNDYVTTGRWHQNANAQAATGSNYPVALAGLLEVYKEGVSLYPDFVYQRYTVYGPNPDVYTRRKYTTTWYAWQKEATTTYVDAKVWDGNDITTGTVVAARLPAASETASGIIERATVAEAVAGTDTTRAVTPAGVTGAMNDASNGYRLRQTVYFTASGTFSKASYSWARAIRVRVQAGGGAGGGSQAASAGNNSFGQGGGGGGYAEDFITNIAGMASSVSVTVGAGGAPVTGGTGGTGGTSAFGSYAQALGGVGGSVKPNSLYPSYVPAGVGGGTASGSLRINGGGGGTGGGYNTLCASGCGGSSQLGGGGATNGGGSGSASYGGVDGGGYGGGGGGSSTNASGPADAGGYGGSGIVIVEIFA